MRDQGGGERDRGAPGPGGLFPLSVTLRMQRKLDGLKLPNITMCQSGGLISFSEIDSLASSQEIIICTFSQYFVLCDEFYKIIVLSLYW